jgi:hypothetical protein
MSDIKKIDLNEFINEGYLQEVNRQFFHPLGLALNIEIDENNKATIVEGIWDYRDDPEGVVFADLSTKEDQQKASNVDKELLKFSERRTKRFGWSIQPIGHKFEE